MTSRSFVTSLRRVLMVLTPACLTVGVLSAIASPGATQPATAPANAKVTSQGWFAPPGKAEKPPLPDAPSRVFIIPIREEIKVKTFEAIRRKAARCRDRAAELVVLDMDTWGGEVGAALDIARLIKVELDDIYVVCYVRTRGVSAGALIAIACDEIVITPVGKLGDCAPIVMGGKLEGTEREKIETVLRKEFAESAERNGYNVALAESLVSITREVWLVRNKSTRELRYVLRKDFRGRVAIPPGVTTGPSNPKGKWELLRVVVPDGELLTMHPREAVEYGFASQTVKAPLDEPLAGVMKHFNVQGEPVTLADNWSERLVGLLTSPAVLGFLFFVAILCAYVEMHTPGFGVAGGVAIACFAIIFGSRYLVGLAAWWEIAIFIVGIALVVTEIFVTPGFGVLGTAGIICCVVGLLAIIIPNAPDKLPLPRTDLDWSVFSASALSLGIGFVAALVAAAMIARFLPKVPVASALILAPAEAPTGPATEDAPIRSIQPGHVGVVEGTCRPVGIVRFGDHLVDSVADGEFIPAGTTVKVLKNEGNRVVVTPIESS